MFHQHTLACFRPCGWCSTHFSTHVSTRAHQGAHVHTLSTQVSTRAHQGSHVQACAGKDRWQERVSCAVCRMQQHVVQGHVFNVNTGACMDSTEGCMWPEHARVHGHTHKTGVGRHAGVYCSGRCLRGGDTGAGMHKMPGVRMGCSYKCMGIRTERLWQTCSSTCMCKHACAGLCVC